MLISVPPETRADFEAFAEGMAEELPADAEALYRFLWAGDPVKPL